ncbi:uncharacterized protein LOC119576181 [Penaeus monodon]|uniref:uncharacterized protein LOC119576181 n=1 Tax=Penaeus monodon TaxID=6687 RepID=UPI0018A6E934|nr:uncharacterized protein LOC119576181 [Penaeus monodon]
MPFQPVTNPMSTIITHPHFSRLSLYKVSPNALHIYLETSENGPVFGDGTPLISTEVGQNIELYEDMSPPKVYVIFNGRFEDVAKYMKRPFMCQANPLGVEW